MRGQKGFTQLELVVVLCIVGVTAALASPQFGIWYEDAECRKTARVLVSALREARSRAITFNRQHRLEIDLENKLFRLKRGNRPLNSTSTSWEKPANLVFDWQSLPAGVVANESCSNNSGIVMVTFNAFGSSDSQYLCVMDGKGWRRFQLGVPNATPGKIVLRRWNSAKKKWE